MRGWIIVLALTLVPCAAAAQPDPGWDARRDAAMAEIAGRYTGSATYDNCVRWGFDTLYLAAAIEADARGLDNGIALADAIDDIDNLTDHALSLIGEGTTVGPCAWESAGSPAALHGALGLGWILHRHQDALPDALVAKLTRALDANWRATLERYLVNGNLSVVAGLLLGGEALGYDSGPWTRGLDALERIFAHVRDSGGLELNSPIYTHYHFAPLAALTTLRDERAATMARTLLEYELLVQAHLYLPGGGLGAPQSRDYAGGAADGSDSGMFRMIELMTGEGFDGVQPSGAADGVAAARRAAVPEARTAAAGKNDSRRRDAVTDMD